MNAIRSRPFPTFTIWSTYSGKMRDATAAGNLYQPPIPFPIGAVATVLLVLAVLGGMQAPMAWAQGQTVTLSRYEPATNGWVISNPQIRANIWMSEEGSEYAKVRASITYVGGTVEGYKYNGKIYSEGNRSEWCTECLAASLDELSFSVVKVDATITYQGNVVKSFDGETAALPHASGWLWNESVGADHSEADYAINVSRISSTRQEGMERDIQGALDDAERLAPQEAAREQRSQQEATSSSESDESTSGGYWSSSEEETSGSTTSGDSQAQSSTSRSSGLTRSQQQDFDTVVSLAKQYEAAGSYNMAIRQYRIAYDISPQSWIQQKISRLSRAQAAEEERRRNPLSDEDAEKIAEGVRVAGDALYAYEETVDYDDPRILQAYLGALLGYSSSNSDAISSGSGAGFEAAAELNLWIGGGKQYNIGGRAGVDFTLGTTLGGDEDEEMRFRSYWYTYDYAVKVGWGGHVEIGHGLRTYTHNFNEIGSSYDSGVTVEATEPISFISVGNFKQKGASWRLSYFQTTGFSLFGEGDGNISEQGILFERFVDNQLGSWKIGLQGLQTNEGGLEWDDANIFIGYGIDIR